MIQYSGVKDTVIEVSFSEPHHWNLATGSNTATEAHPSLVVRILASLHKILVAHVIWTFIDHETATFYSDGVAATEVSVQVRAVVTALITTTLKIFVLVKNNLKKPTESTLCVIVQRLGE